VQEEEDEIHNLSRDGSPRKVFEATEKMFLHEFMFLVANALDRQIVLSNVKMQKLCIEKVSIGTHEGVRKYDGRKLDKIYQYEDEKRKVR